MTSNLGTCSTSCQTKILIKKDAAQVRNAALIRYDCFTFHPDFLIPTWFPTHEQKKELVLFCFNAWIKFGLNLLGLNLDEELNFD